MESQLFDKHMAMLQAYFGHNVEPQILSLYWSLLNKLSNAQWERAVSSQYATFAPTSQVPFPLVKHILEAVGEDTDSKSREAVQLVKTAIQRVGPYKSVDFRDGALHWVIASYGGWVALCNWTDKDWSINEGRFIESYKAARAAGTVGPDYLAGIADTHNSAAGLVQYVAEPVRPAKDGSGRITWVGGEKKAIEDQGGDKVQQLPAPMADEPQSMAEIITADGVGK